MISMKKLRKDIRGTESLLAPILLISGFFCAFFVLTTQIAPIIAENDRPILTLTAPPAVMDLVMDQYLTQWAPAPFHVNSSYADNSWTPRDTPMVTFSPGGGEEHPLHVWLVRNDPWKSHTSDYLVFQQTYGWFGTKQAVAFVSYKEITGAYDNLTQYSRVTLDLRYVLEVVFWTTGSPGLPVAIWEDNYNITVATSLNETLSSLSPWGLIGKIASFQLPGVNPVITALLGMPLLMMIFYACFVVVRSVIPLLGG